LVRIKKKGHPLPIPEEGDGLKRRRRKKLMSLRPDSIGPIPEETELAPFL
jgi:hypothetical protein